MILFAKSKGQSINQCEGDEKQLAGHGLAMTDMVRSRGELQVKVLKKSRCHLTRHHQTDSTVSRAQSHTSTNEQWGHYDTTGNPTEPSQLCGIEPSV